MKNLKALFIIVVLIYISGCGSEGSTVSTYEAQAGIETAWTDVQDLDYTSALTAFQTIINTDSNIEVQNEARVGIAMVYLAKEAASETEKNNNIVTAQNYLEDVFGGSYDTIYQPYSFDKIDNGDARAMLAMTYMLTGDIEKFNANLNLAKEYGTTDYDTQLMIDSLTELLN